MDLTKSFRRHLITSKVLYKVCLLEKKSHAFQNSNFTYWTMYMFYQLLLGSSFSNYTFLGHLQYILGMQESCHNKIVICRNKHSSYLIFCLSILPSQPKHTFILFLSQSKIYKPFLRWNKPILVYSFFLLHSHNFYLYPHNF